jgi:hypothetical protein
MTDKEMPAFVDHDTSKSKKKKCETRLVDSETDPVFTEQEIKKFSRVAADMWSDLVYIGKTKLKEYHAKLGAMKLDEKREQEALTDQLTVTAAAKKRAEIEEAKAEKLAAAAKQRKARAAARAAAQPSTQAAEPDAGRKKKQRKEQAAARAAAQPSTQTAEPDTKGKKRKTPEQPVTKEEQEAEVERLREEIFGPESDAD